MVKGEWARGGLQYENDIPLLPVAKMNQDSECYSLQLEPKTVHLL